MSEKKLKHLEIIQGVISRMAGNLFYLRGWIITLIAGALVLLTNTSGGQRFQTIFLALIILLFWCYDGYFLSLERMYRDLYDKVRQMDERNIDFSMDITEFKKFKKNTVIFSMFSPTLLFFYSFLLLATLYVIFFIK